MQMVRDNVSSPRAENVFVCNSLLYPGTWNHIWHIVGTRYIFIEGIDE